MGIMMLAGVDIGSPSLKGSTFKDSNGLEITAGGADIWGTSDQCHFSCQEHVGDFDFITCVEALGAADLYTKAGIMARETLEADSRHVYILTFPDNRPRNNNNGGFEFQYRASRGGISKAIYPSDFTTQPPQFAVNFPNTWMRLSRSGDRFDASYSTSGSQWALYCSFTLALNPRLYLGIAVTSHNDQQAVTARVGNMSIRP
jgi:regulation of enolase protein 1 (concanavalin A-like superfamily)